MFQILQGDWIEQLKTLPNESVQCVVTSPPYYGLRDYGVKDQLGLEKTPEEYVAKIVDGFREVKRVLRNDGTLWLNLGDSYSSHKDCKSIGQTLAKGTSREDAHVMPLGLSRVRDSRMLKKEGFKNKDLIGIPWMVAFALRADGWYLRQDIIWAKPNPMPESVTDRCTKSHEYIFLLTKAARYYYNAKAIMEPLQTFENRPYGIVRDRDFNYASKQKILRSKVASNSKKADAQYITNASQKKWAERVINGEIPESRNKRSVWFITTKPYKEAHFAAFPPEIPKICILAGSKKGDIILDPFAGSGTTGEVALKLDRNFIGIELNQRYVNDLIIPRLENINPLFRREDEHKTQSH